jgi:orotate phosphoribosyltransferase
MTDIGEMTDTDATIDRQAVLAHIKAYSVKVAQPGREFDLASGGKSRLYVDAKRTYFHRDMHRPLAALIHREVQQFGHAEAVAGVALGGCHLASIVAAHAGGGNYNVIYVRKVPKDHGTKNLVEHAWCRFGEWVVLLEDVVSTGQSSALAVQALRSDGFDVRGIVTVIDRRPPASRTSSVDGVGIRHLFGLEDLGIDPDVAAILSPTHESVRGTGR